LLKLPYGAGKLAEPVKRQIARECINRFTAAELGQVRLGEYPVWFVEPYVNQRFRGVPAPAAPAVEPEMNTTVAATAGRLNSRAQDVFLTVHRVALQRTLETRVPRGSPEFRPLWRSFGCRRYKMLSATERKKYMVAALSARTKMRAPNGQWQFLLADEVAEQDIAIDLDSFIAEISKNKKITPKELLDEVVRIEKTDAGKGALKKASDRLMTPKKHQRRLGIRIVVRRGGGVPLAPVSRRGRCWRRTVSDVKLLELLAPFVSITSKWCAKVKAPMKTLKGTKRDIFSSVKEIHQAMSYRQSCRRLYRARLGRWLGVQTD
jgi:hypothetical protein